MDFIGMELYPSGCKQSPMHFHSVSEKKDQYPELPFHVSTGSSPASSSLKSISPLCGTQTAHGPYGQMQRRVPPAAGVPRGSRAKRRNFLCPEI